MEEGFDNTAIFRKKHMPLLVVAGTSDRIIPIQHADDLYAAASEPKMYARIEGAGHTGDRILMSSVKYSDTLRDFVSHLQGHAN